MGPSDLSIKFLGLKIHLKSCAVRKCKFFVFIQTTEQTKSSQEENTVVDPKKEKKKGTHFF
jgi:hypothetical protein